MKTIPRREIVRRQNLAAHQYFDGTPVHRIRDSFTEIAWAFPIDEWQPFIRTSKTVAWLIFTNGLLGDLLNAFHSAKRVRQVLDEPPPHFLNAHVSDVFPVRTYLRREEMLQEGDGEEKVERPPLLNLAMFHHMWRSRGIWLLAPNPMLVTDVPPFVLFFLTPEEWDRYDICGKKIRAWEMAKRANEFPARTGMDRLLMRAIELQTVVYPSLAHRLHREDQQRVVIRNSLGVPPINADFDLIRAWDVLRMFKCAIKTSPASTQRHWEEKLGECVEFLVRSLMGGDADPGWFGVGKEDLQVSFGGKTVLEYLGEALQENLVSRWESRPPKNIHTRTAIALASVLSTPVLEDVLDIPAYKRMSIFDIFLDGMVKLSKWYQRDSYLQRYGKVPVEIELLKDREGVFRHMVVNNHVLYEKICRKISGSEETTRDLAKLFPTTINYISVSRGVGGQRDDNLDLDMDPRL